MLDGVEEAEYKLNEEIKQTTLRFRDEEAKVFSLQVMLDEQGQVLQENNDQIYELEEEKKAFISQIDQLTKELSTINEENRSQGNLIKQLDGARRMEMSIAKGLRNSLKEKKKEIDRLNLMVSSYQSRIRTKVKLKKVSMIGL